MGIHVCSKVLHAIYTYIHVCIYVRERDEGGKKRESQRESVDFCRVWFTYLYLLENHLLFRYPRLHNLLLSDWLVFWNEGKNNDPERMMQIERGGEQRRNGGGQTMVKKRSLKMQFSLTTLMAYSNETQVNHSLYKCIIPQEYCIHSIQRLQ